IRDIGVTGVQTCALPILTLRPSWSPRGAWRRVVRSIATRRIDEVLRKLRAEEGVSRDAERCAPTLPRSAPQSLRVAANRAGVFAALDRAGVAYCLPHGAAGSDVDCVTDARPDRVTAVLHDSGAAVVRCLSGHVVVAGTDADGSPCVV